ncbi:MAG: prepilin-type N-terminal cleavage/methylation domain-containing protein [Chitinispirillaceae bacterium]|nr:prepilin-type N-terminal cleavage/methylation domain-containing protein [Chitinispirillaceae bacterium]
MMTPHRCSTRNHTGFTLVEAIMALSLLSLIGGMAYSFYQFAHKQVFLREQKAFVFDEAMLILESVAKNVRQSRATIMLDEGQWVFLKPGGDTARYVFTDGILRYNTLPLMAGGRLIPGFSFSCSGNDSLLDSNGDQTVDFNELDQDGNNRITGSETGSIVWIKASIVLSEDRSRAFETIEAVKNHLNSDGDMVETYFR